MSQAWQQVGVLSGTAPGTPAGAPEDRMPVSPFRPPQTVRVRRTGGVTGAVREAAVDLSGDPKGPELQVLLDRSNFTGLTSRRPGGPDRFTYAVEYRDQQAVFGEQELTDELRQIVRLVLDD